MIMNLFSNQSVISEEADFGLYHATRVVDAARYITQVSLSCNMFRIYLRHFKIHWWALYARDMLFDCKDESFLFVASSLLSDKESHCRTILLSRPARPITWSTTAIYLVHCDPSSATPRINSPTCLPASKSCFPATRVFIILGVSSIPIPVSD
jgi:hypothetical protein